MRKVTLLLATVALAALLAALPAWADTTFTVDSANDAPDADPGDGACSTAAGECTLRAAIEEANNLDGDDVVGFEPSVEDTITLGGSNLLIGSNLKIEGPGADKLSVDADGLSRVFNVESGTVEISGLTITGGKAEDGSTDICSEADNGGGIFNEATLTLSDSTISRSTSECGGGGIYNRGTLTVSNSTISDNTTTHASAGGGIYVEGADTTTISDTTVTGNTAAGNGGGISSGGYAALTVSDSTISDNEAGYDGGGVYSFPNDRDRGSTSVERSTISGNEAARNGGGIYSRSVSVGGDSSASKTTVTNSTISANTAAGRGGGVYNENGLTEIGHSTITGNTAPAGNGGGVASYGDAFTSTEVYSSIVSANDNPENTGTDVDFVEDSTNSFVSEGYNLVGDGHAADAFDAQGDQTGVLDPKLGPLEDNGGPTKTHLPLADQDSLTIDQGNGAEGPATDQRGEARTHDHPDFANAQGSDGSDVGAVEVVASAEPPPPPPPPDDQACTIKGTGGKDVLRGTAHRDVICAYGGNDAIKGRGGNDLMLGGSGDDTIAGGTGDDRLYGGPSGDVLDARDGSGGDLADGGRGDDTCSADRGDRKKNCS